MTTLTLQLSDESIVILPADLARQAGLEEGTSVEAMVTAEGLTIAPMRAYAETWRVLENSLRYQATTLGLIGPDRRDETYWQIVDPMLHDLEHDIPA
jgi:hypothetical protein